jgi:putative aldouronate transport system permease protein
MQHFKNGVIKNSATKNSKGGKKSPLFNKKFLDNFQLYLLMMPGIIATIVFAYIPIYGIQIAFKDFSGRLGIWKSEWVGLEHFARFINYLGFWKLLKNTIAITLYSLSTFPIPIVVALLINEISSKKFKKTVQMVSYAPYFLSTVVMCGIIILFLDRSSGVINNFLALFGLERISFITKSEYFRSIYVWSDVWKNVGWGTVIYLAALSGVSPELIESVKIDGGNKFHIIRHINIPAILPTVIILFILSTGGILSLGHEKILLLQNDLNLNTSRVISTYVYEIGLVGGQLSYSTAINLFNSVSNLLISSNHFS